MIGLPEMLVEPAKRAGMKVPSDLENYDPDAFPHWHVFCAMQLGAPCPTAGIHWENAKVIANIPENKIRNITAAQVIKLGFGIST